MKNKALSITVLSCVAFTVAINTSATFASTISYIPVVGKISKYVTISEYTNNGDPIKVVVKEVKIPETVEEELANKVDRIITTKINELVDRATSEAIVCKKEFISIGGNPSEFKRINTTFNVSIKLITDEVVSFVIVKKEEGQYEKETKYMYNINLETGLKVELSDILGEDYSSVIDGQIERKIREKSKKDEKLLEYYLDIFKSKNLDIAEMNNFYINKKGNPVLVFEPHMIAPQYAGEQKFEIVR